LATTTEKIVEPRELAERLAHEADALKGDEIVILDVAELLFVTDFFVIITAQSNRQMRAIASKLNEVAKEVTGHKGRLEGDNHSEWLLMDLDTVVVHVFTPEAREFYNLETLWAD